MNGDKVMEAVSEFYTDLFAGGRGVSAEEMREYCEKVDARLSEEDRFDMCVVVSEEEVRRVIDGINRNKTPGKDGLTVEFFCKAWEVMKNEVCELVRLVFAVGEMPKSLREGVITLIYKKGDKRDIRNWRPITLLNVDYKIVARLIADRVWQSDWGAAGVCGSWSTNLSLLRDVVYYAQSNNLPCLLELIDPEKAYDKVSHQFLFQILEVLGFPDQLMKVIRGLYKGVSSQVLVNGTLGGSIPVMSGVGRGAPYRL